MSSKAKKILSVSAVSVLLSALLVYLIIDTIKTDLKESIGPASEIKKNFADFKGEDANKQLLNFLDSIDGEYLKAKEELSGGQVTVLITGVDSRIGSTRKHADANHIITAWLDKGKVEIISIPRGTWAYAGFEEPEIDSLLFVDSTFKFYTKNYLANVRAYRGVKEYERAVRRIAGIKKIDYRIEFGFSQAIALLELMGFRDNSLQMLRVLRTRQVYGGQEHQRNYNQGQFIKQMIYKLFPLLEGIEGEILLRSALMIVDTDIEIGRAKDIVEQLREKGFPRSPYDIIHRVTPKYPHPYYTYDFTDSRKVDSLYRRLAERSQYISSRDGEPDSYDDISALVKKKLNARIDKALPLVYSDPYAAIRELKIPFEQRAWFQLADKKQREHYRKLVCDILYKAYMESGNSAKAGEVMAVYEMEQKLKGRIR